jgi:transcriptional regulator with XRE-family HTH domain
MAKKKTHYSVLQMVRDVSEDASFADAFENHLLERKLVKKLLVVRALRGLSQKDMARKLGCTQSRISKLEAAKDNELRLGDLVQYANALGLRLEMVFEPRDTRAVGRIRRHTFQIKQELQTLAELSAMDHAITAGASRFFGEAMVNFVKILQDSPQRLPARPEDRLPCISFAVYAETEDEHEAETSPKKGADLGIGGAGGARRSGRSVSWRKR